LYVRSLFNTRAAIANTDRGIRARGTNPFVAIDQYEPALRRVVHYQDVNLLADLGERSQHPTFMLGADHLHRS
jgi:hypothetical protein